ncbi:MAG: hypothetical protein K0S32_4544 [Bacteroidetes bacterium]|jgi:hypothetical protein|nr:hypothetical protein [Bacteroidota bacterium]
MRNKQFIIPIILLALTSILEFFSCTNTAIAQPLSGSKDTLSADVHNTPVKSVVKTILSIEQFFYEKGKPEAKGALVSKEYFDKNGHELKSETYTTYSGLESSWESEYSASGKKLNQKGYNSAGSLIAEARYTYSDKDSLIKTDTYGAPRTIMGRAGEVEHYSISEIRYNRNGKRNYIFTKRIKEDNFDLHEYEFDDMGRELRHTSISGKNSLSQDSAYREVHITTYDEKGNWKNRTWITRKDTVYTNKFICEYSPSGLLITSTEKGNDGKDWSREEYSYDNKERITSKKVFSSGDKKQFDFYSYYDNGKLKQHRKLEFSFYYNPVNNENGIEADTLIKTFDINGKETESHNYSSYSDVITHKTMKYDSQGKLSEIAERTYGKNKGYKRLLKYTYTVK